VWFTTAFAMLVRTDAFYRWQPLPRLHMLCVLGSRVQRCMLLMGSAQLTEALPKGCFLPCCVEFHLLPRLTEEGLMPRHIRHHFCAAAPEHVPKVCFTVQSRRKQACGELIRVVQRGLVCSQVVFRSCLQFRTAIKKLQTISVCLKRINALNCSRCAENGWLFGLKITTFRNSWSLNRQGDRSIRYIRSIYVVTLPQGQR